MSTCQAKPCEAHGGIQDKAVLGSIPSASKSSSPQPSAPQYPGQGQMGKSRRGELMLAEGKVSPRLPTNLKTLGKPTCRSLTRLSPQRAVEAPGQGSDRGAQGRGSGTLQGMGGALPGLLMETGQRKGIYFPLFKGWRCKGFGEKPGCESYAAGCLSCCSGHLLGQVPLSLGTQCPWVPPPQLAGAFLAI